MFLIFSFIWKATLCEISLFSKFFILVAAAAATSCSWKYLQKLFAAKLNVNGEQCFNGMFNYALPLMFLLEFLFFQEIDQRLFLYYLLTITYYPQLRQELIYKQLLMHLQSRLAYTAITVDNNIFGAKHCQKTKFVNKVVHWRNVSTRTFLYLFMSVSLML